jgi:hypothetical protein
MSAIVRDGGAGAGLSAIEAQAQALDVALRAAKALKDARGLLPESLRSEGEIVAVLLAGQELGLPPMAALRGLQVVRGKVIISYDTMVALLRRAGYRVEWLESTATRAVLRLRAPDSSEHVETWDEQRARKAGLWGGKGPWSSYPETMLRARCVSSAARAFAGEVLAGVYVEEAGEREEIAARVVERPVHREPERPSTIDAQLVELEATSVPSRPAPTQLTQTATAGELQAWCGANGGKLRALTGARQGEAIGKVVAHAERIGVGAEDVWRWLELPVAEEEAAQ